MIEQLGRFIGRAAADVVNIVRNRSQFNIVRDMPQFMPCTVDWNDEYQSRYFGATVDEQCCGRCNHGCFAE